MRALPVMMLLAGMFSATANAALIQFDDRAAFIAATGAVGIGAIPQNVPGAGFNLGGLSFTPEGPSSFNTSIDWSSLISESFDLALNDKEQFNVDSPGPLFAFGFDFHEPGSPPPPLQDTCNFPCTDSTFQITLLSGAALVDTFSFTRGNDTLEFVGFTSSLAFDRIEIRETTGTADNEFFGNFLISRTPAIPEPSSLLLLGLGLVALRARKTRVGSR